MQNKIVQCDDQQFTAYELTLGEVRSWMNDFTQGGSCNLVDELATPGISLSDLAIIFRCKPCDFDQLTYRDLEKLASAARELNPHFFRVRDMVGAVVEKMMMEADTIISAIPKHDEVA